MVWDDHNFAPILKMLLHEIISDPRVISSFVNLASLDVTKDLWAEMEGELVTELESLRRTLVLAPCRRVHRAAHGFCPAHAWDVRGPVGQRHRGRTATAFRPE